MKQEVKIMHTDGTSLHLEVLDFEWDSDTLTCTLQDGFVVYPLVNIRAFSVLNTTS